MPHSIDVHNLQFSLCCVKFYSTLSNRQHLVISNYRAMDRFTLNFSLRANSLSHPLGYHYVVCHSTTLVQSVALQREGNHMSVTRHQKHPGALSKMP